MKIEKIALEIVEKEKAVAKPATTISQVKIDEALEIANFIRDKTSNLLSEVELAIQDLNGVSKPSVLESQDDFKSLLLRLKQMKKKLTVV